MTLDDIKAIRFEEFQRRSKEILEAGKEYTLGTQTEIVRLAPTDRESYHALLTIMTLEPTVGPITQYPFEIRVKDHSHSLVFDDPTELMTFCLWVFQTVQLVYHEEWLLIDAVDAAQTIAEAYAVEDNRSIL